ncbi:MAG: DUF4062 domain-containing protein [Planctomycetaceae bacterium]|nr:DUF4062 domain-containing protein [Planctomycetaceae bacterium]
MKVFVSSTVYDLIDARAEVAGLLTSMGIAPVLSDDKLSGFDSAHAANSIETCLINVAASDEVIVILDQRYSARLGKVGFEDVSATHLEYRKARELKLPIHVFVRDRLEADYTTWRKNRKHADLLLPWVEQKDYGIFDLLEEHRKLTSKPEKNWILPFTTSVDLKDGIRRLMEPRIKPKRVLDAIARNQFPLFVVESEFDSKQQDGVWMFTIRLTIRNVGGSAAFNVSHRFSEEAETAHKYSIVAPTCSVFRFVTQTSRIQIPDMSGQLLLQYDSTIGVRVIERYEFRARVAKGLGGAMLS